MATKNGSMKLISTPQTDEESDDDCCFLPNHPQTPITAPTSGVYATSPLATSTPEVKRTADVKSTPVTTSSVSTDARTKGFVSTTAGGSTSPIAPVAPLGYLHAHKHHNKKKGSSVSFSDDVTRQHSTELVDVRQLVWSAFRFELKSPASQRDDVDVFNSSMMMSDLNLQQRVYLEREAGGNVPESFPRPMSLEEESQARVVQLRELGRTWQRRYEHEHKELQKLRDHLVNCQKRCEDVVSTLCQSFMSTINRLKLDVKLEQKTRVELLKERRTLEQNFKKTLDQHELKRKELKRNNRDAIKAFKHLQKNAKTCEKLLRGCQTENNELKSRVCAYEEEVSVLKRELHHQDYQIEEYKARDTCYEQLLDLTVRVTEKDPENGESNCANDTECEPGDNVNRKQSRMCINVPNVGKYQLKVDEHNPCVMELQELLEASTNTTEPSNTSLSEITSDSTVEHNNNTVKDVVNLNLTPETPPSPTSHTVIMRRNQLKRCEKTLDNTEEEELTKCNPRDRYKVRSVSVNESVSHLRRSHAFNNHNHQWKRSKSEVVKPVRRVRPPLLKRHTVDDGLIYTGSMDEFLEYKDTVGTKERTASAGDEPVEASSDGGIAGASEDLSIITRSEPSLMLSGSPDSNGALLTHIDNREYNRYNLQQRRSPMLKSYSDDVDDRLSVASGHSGPKSTSGESSAFAGLRSRRNGIFGMSPDLEIPVKSLKKTKKQELTDKLRKFARDLAHHENDSKTKKKERRSSNW